MKKLNVIIMLILVFSTGCGKGKKIECSYYEQNDNLKITYDYVLMFDSNKENLYNLELTIGVDAKNKETLEEFNTTNNICDTFIDYKELKENDHIKCQSKKEDTKILFTVTYDYDQLTEAEKSKLFGNLKFDEAKLQYENNNYEKNMCAFNSNKKMEPVLKKGGVIGNLNIAQKNAAIDTASSILMAAEEYIILYMLENGGTWNGDIKFVCDGNGCFANIDGVNIKLDYRGMVPTAGEIYLTSTGEAIIKKELIINGYICNMNSTGDIECSR